MSIYLISLSSSTRSYLLTLFGDETEVIEERSKARIMQAARRHMESGDYLLYCPDLPCHEMYGCFEVYSRRGANKRLFNCAHRYYESEAFFEADRIFSNIQVLSVREALAVYGEYWGTGEMGYHDHIDRGETIVSSVAWSGVTWDVSSGRTSVTSTANRVTCYPLVISGEAEIEVRWVRDLHHVDAYHSGYFLVLTLGPLLVTPALRVREDCIETEVGVAYPNLVEVNGRELIIYCVRSWSGSRLAGHLKTQILLMREAMRRILGDTYGNRDVGQPHKMVVDLDARMVTL